MNLALGVAQLQGEFDPTGVIGISQDGIEFSGSMFVGARSSDVFGKFGRECIRYRPADVIVMSGVALWCSDGFAGRFVVRVVAGVFRFQISPLSKYLQIEREILRDIRHREPECDMDFVKEEGIQGV